MRSTLVPGLLVLLATGPLAPAQEAGGFEDELSLRALGLAADGPGILEFLRLRTLPSVEPARIAGLVKSLADGDEAVRIRAYRELAGLGPLAVPALRAAVNDPDTGVANRLARQCLEIVQGERNAQTLRLCLRVLSDRKPEGAVGVLMNFTPQVDNDDLFEELKRTLADLAYDAAGKPEAALLAGLADDHPLRRAVAAETLGARGGEPRAALLKLLDDPQGSVRLRAGLALAPHREAKALETLISLLATLPENLAREAEDYLIGVAGDQAPKVAVGGEDGSAKKAHDAWLAWWKASEAAGLLEEFRKRTMIDERREQALALIRKLADEDFKVRLASREELMRMGVVVVPLLRKAAQDGTADPELREQAKKALVEIEKVAPGSLSPVYARLVAFRKPAGAIEVLLDFLPFADEDLVLGEVQEALNVLAYQGGKPAPALVKALGDKLPLRRAAAAEALCAVPGAKELEQVRKLLQDPDALVRLKTAVALAGAHDRDAVAALIEMIATAPPDHVARAEEFLARLAGEDVPPGEPGADEAARRKRRDQWAAWWAEKGSKLSLAALLSRPQQVRYLGYTLVINPNMSKIVELARDGKVRWEMNGLASVWDAHFVSPNRLLILETGASRVTERTIRGDILREMRFTNISPVAMQVLPNGNLLLVSYNRLVEMTRSGKEVFNYNRPQGDIFQARKLKNGQVVLVTQNSSVHRIDEKGQEIGSWRINQATNQGIHILPDGNVVYPQQHANRVFEYDPSGKQVWTATANQPMAVQRLANGNTLIGNANPFQIVEVDRTGKEVWKVTSPIQPLRVYRR